MNRYKDLTLRYGDLLECLAGLLRDHAPNLGFEVPADGFLGEAAKVLVRLDEIDSPDRCAQMIRSAFARGFSSRMAGPAYQYETVARQFWAICEGRGWK